MLGGTLAGVAGGGGLLERLHVVFDRDCVFKDRKGRSWHCSGKAEQTIGRLDMEP